jgi:hypothetical protein
MGTHEHSLIEEVEHPVAYMFVVVIADDDGIHLRNRSQFLKNVFVLKVHLEDRPHHQLRHDSKDSEAQLSEEYNDRIDNERYQESIVALAWSTTHRDEIHPLRILNQILKQTQIVSIGQTQRRGHIVYVHQQSHILKQKQDDRRLIYRTNQVETYTLKPEINNST